MYLLIFISLLINLNPQYKLIADLNTEECVSEYAKHYYGSDYEYFKIKINSDSIKIDSDGRCDFFDFNLYLLNDFFIDELHYFQLDSTNIIFQYRLTDMDVSSVFIAKVNLERSNIDWTLGVDGTSERSFIVINGEIYVGAWGFAGKIDIEKGEYIWMHNDLYYKYGISWFDNISVYENFVIYRGEKWRRRYVSLVFDVKTGEKIELY